MLHCLFQIIKKVKGLNGVVRNKLHKWSACDLYYFIIFIYVLYYYYHVSHECINFFRVLIIKQELHARIIILCQTITSFIRSFFLPLFMPPCPRARPYDRLSHYCGLLDHRSKVKVTVAHFFWFSSVVHWREFFCSIIFSLFCPLHNKANDQKQLTSQTRNKKSSVGLCVSSLWLFDVV